MRVLFLHYSDYLEAGIHGGIAGLSALLKQAGHETKVFDTSFLKPDHYKRSYKAAPSIFKKTAYTLEDLVEKDPVVDIRAEFVATLKKYNPDLVAVSAMTTNLDDTLELLRSVDIHCPVLMGGVHATLNPEEILSENKIDAVCVSEGEGALLEYCLALEKGLNPQNIRNLWFKDNGEIVRNGLRPFEDLDRLPIPDWSIFDERHLFRPFEGQIYKGSFITSSRGCPGACTYCVNKVLRGITKDCGNYFRRQSPETTIKQIRHLKEQYGATWFKFADDTFLLHTIEELEALRDGLKGLRISFGCSVQPLTIKRDKVALSRDMGCVAMTVGVESGNDEIRRKILNRKISNEQLEEGIRTIIDADIRVSTFNMIGLPGEKRENVFETIRFNKKLGIKAANVYILYPFPGTEISKTYGTNYREANGKMIPMSEAARFGLSAMSRQEVEGLRKTFNLYLLLPEQYWPEVKEAEGEDDRARQKFEELEKLAVSFA